MKTNINPTDYLVETHMHTEEISACANVSAEDGINLLKSAGFDAAVITDHFNKHTLKRLGASWQEQVDNWLQGYRKALEIGQQIGIDVYLGAEISLKNHIGNDYLLYGVTEEFLFNIEGVFSYKLKELCKIAHENNIIVVQAHPYRNGNIPRHHKYLDGLEVLNGNPRHINRNKLAMRLAKKNNMIMTAGGDFHEIEDISYGVRLENSVSTNDELVAMLRHRKYELIDIRE